jgi:hypothetical protein
VDSPPNGSSYDRAEEAQLGDPIPQVVVLGEPHGFIVSPCLLEDIPSNDDARLDDWVLKYQHITQIERLRSDVGTRHCERFGSDANRL